tara:strand:+ start:1644 stop:2612 length:969 start_codon:yes stop_codon:yes gene_type:complete
MLNVAVLGAGNIGSRHLQGLVKINKNLNIYVVDKKKTSLSIAKKRINEVKLKKYKKNFIFLQNQNNLPNKIALAIISTNSDIREGITLKLIKKTQVKYLIFEKFVFQNSKSFIKVIESLKNKKIKSWVNCPFRTFKGYINLKNKIKNINFKMKVIGGNWGMASNLIHYLDLFSFLSDTYKINITKKKLDKKIYNSKRKNFKEISGALEIVSENGNHLNIEDNKSTEPVKVIIKTKKKLFKIFEEKNIVKIFDNKNKLIKQNIFKLPYQSDLTNIVVKNILIKKNSSLITLEKSSILHKKVIKLILEHINLVQKKQTVNCPIT